MKDNNKRNIMEFWTRKRIPYVFDETLSLYQLVRLTIKYLNQVIEDQNELKDAIKEFIEMFDEDLEDTVIEVLEKWKDDGSLKEIINEALFESKLDKKDFNTFKESTNKSLNEKVDEKDFNTFKESTNISLNEKVDESLFNNKEIIDFYSGKPFFAHRGLSAYYPENTMIAFEKAIEYGFEGIELDLQISQDGKIYVLHDLNVERMTNGEGNISDLSSDYLNGLLIDNGKNIRYLGKYEGSFPFGVEIKLPTIDNILDFISSTGCKAQIELKETFTNDSQFLMLLDMIDSYDLYKNVTLMSFNLETIKSLRRLNDKIMLTWVVEGLNDTHIMEASNIGNCAISAHISSQNKALLNKKCKSMKVPIGYWYLATRDVNELKNLLATGVDYVVHEALGGLGVEREVKSLKFSTGYSKEMPLLSRPNYSSDPFAVYWHDEDGSIKIDYLHPFSDNLMSFATGTNAIASGGSSHPNITVKTRGENANGCVVNLYNNGVLVTRENIPSGLYVTINAFGRKFV